jgi:hypothetical protein
MKIVVILNIPPPTTVYKLHTTLGHTGYYHQFIWGYMSITTPLEQLLKKSEGFRWTLDCDKAFNLLKKIEHCTNFDLS